MSLALPAIGHAGDAAAARRRAILCVLGEGLCFAIAAALIKSTKPAPIPIFEMVVFRSVVIVLVMGVVLARGGGGLLAALRTRHIFGNLLRTGLGYIGMTTSYVGYLRLPLATTTSLNFAMPLFLTALSVPLLGERVGWRRWAAVLVGLGGVLMMLRPWREATESLPMRAAAVVLAGVLAWALTTITIRKMGAAGERAATIVLWYSIGSLVISVVLAVPVWVQPTWREAALLTIAGLFTAAAQWLMTEGYRGGEATAVAPFEYGAILHTTVLGALFWNEWPDGWTLAGIAVLVVAGVYIWRRETGRPGLSVPNVAGKTEIEAGHAGCCGHKGLERGGHH
jgi:drug/metabolite transporter (DMT)-like permease